MSLIRTVTLGLMSIFSVLFTAVPAQAISSTWLTPTEYPADNVTPFPDWFDSSHWAGGVIANGAGSIATFNNLTNRLNLRITDFSAGAATPGNATTLTLGGLVVTTQRIDSRPYGPTSTINWNNLGSTVIITHPSAEFLLSHNHILTDSVSITKSGGQTRFARTISGPGGFILSGGQEFVLGETGTANTFAGGIRLLNNTTVDVRTPVSMGSGALTFANTSTTAVMTPRNGWTPALPNAFVVETGGSGRIREEGGDADRTFSGAISGGGNLTIQAKDSLYHFTFAGGSNGTTGKLTVQGDATPGLTTGVAADAAGVFSNFTEIDVNTGARFVINAANVFSDAAIVTMDAASFFEVGTSFNEVVGSLKVNNVVIANGTYLGGTQPWLQGTGRFTVGAAAVIVPEPATLMLLGMAGLLGMTRRRTA